MRALAGVLFALLLVGCVGGPEAQHLARSDVVWETYMEQAADSFSRGEYGRAAQGYLDALQRARRIDAPVEIGTAAFNAASCLVRIGKLDDALPLLVEAAFARGEEGLPTVQVYLLEARIHLARRALDDAEDVLDRLKEASLDSGLQAELQVLEARLLYARGDSGAALDRLDAIESRALSPRVETTAIDLRAEIAEAQGAWLEAARLRERKLALLQASGSAELGRTAEDAARSYAMAGEPEPAARLYYRAARIATGGFELDRAAALAAEGLRLALESESEELQSALAALAIGYPLGTRTTGD